MKAIILGSSSQWRRGLFKRAIPEGWSQEVELMSADIDEKAIRFPNPEDLTKAIANAKADELMSRLKAAGRGDEDSLLVTADQVITHNGVIREKPVDAAQAKEFLQSYKDAPAVCWTGIVVTHVSTGRRIEGVDRAVQHFDAVPDEVVDAMVKQGDIMTCAGAFVVESPILAPYVREREGEIEAVQGMPISMTRKFLLSF